MTDIIKRVGMLDSKDLLAHLKDHPALVEQNIENFREELCDLNCSAPTILAFGVGAYNIIRNNLRTAGYSKLIKLTHYSHQIRGKNGVLMFIAFGAFALLCGFEFRYFEMKMGFSSTSPGFVIVWASVITVGGYYMEKWVRNARVRNRQG